MARKKQHEKITLNYQGSGCYVVNVPKDKNDKDITVVWNPKTKTYDLKKVKKEPIVLDPNNPQDKKYIDYLLAPKVLTNFKRYTKDGEVPFTGFNRNEKGEIIDNIIIKGDNLHALASLGAGKFPSSKEETDDTRR